jgi:AcrR family transcriptional regulator
MAEQVKRRAYDSPRRREQAAGTRALILAEAQRLFERDGYAATSMATIASAAGVALKTVYLGFGSKPALLRAVWHRALRGDRDDVPVGEQAWFRDVLDEPDPRRMVARAAHASRLVKERAGAIMEVIRAAAPGDAEIGGLWSRIQTEFHANQRTIVESLAKDGALAPGLDTDTAADVLWALNHPTLYQLLVSERGWTVDRYEQWLDDLLAARLLADPGPAPDLTRRAGSGS